MTVILCEVMYSYNTALLLNYEAAFMSWDWWMNQNWNDLCTWKYKSINIKKSTAEILKLKTDKLKKK